ncbi:thiamine pyrophosphate-binding protein [Amorphus sp. 3PC139-8]|uniref:thiamine pyrophosphate-binding protein n=1 Tax=Amorphus sp. 3PC139-8 TaxID=2735676 RepID=UPI00345DB7F2
MTTGAELIAAKLAAIGCRSAFGIPGGEVLALVDALDRAGVRFVLTKHETPAGFFAEGGWHATGVPGILVATLGPGLANAVNAIANAHQDRVPLIVLTGCVDQADADTYTHQVFDHRALLAPIVKASFRAAPGSLNAVMDKALVALSDGQPGPVHIDVPIGVAEGETGEVAGPAPVLPAPAMPAPGPDLDTARAWLAASRRPLAIAGVDAVNEEAGPEIAAFCRRFGVPLITSYKGKGLIDETDPLALGGAGLSPKADHLLKPLLDVSDLILLLGYDPIEMRIGWRNPWRADKHVIEIAPVVRDHGMHSVSLLLKGAIAPTLDTLMASVAPRPVWPEGEPAAVRTSLGEAFAPGSDWGPAQVFATVRDGLPKEAVITADSGAHRILLSQMWTAHHPRTLLQSSALCTMGCAVPLAAGYKLAHPNAPVVAFVGDAGLEMNLGELATIRDLGLALTIVVLVDESLALIELKQRAQQRPSVGVEFGGTDFPAVAEALGGVGRWVDDAETLASQLDEALGRDGFTILAARIDRRAYDGAF